MKRIFLFLVTNAAVLLVLAVVLHLLTAFFGVDLRESVGDWKPILVWALIFGMAGSIVSLLLSKPMAKMSVGAKTITGSEGEAEAWLVRTVEELAQRANLKTPEVAIYHGSANAFATGAFRNSALVAVSDGIMAQMTREELRAVLGHEMSHVANGDMVTMCLLQGILNTFVLFASRVAASLLSQRGGNRRGEVSAGLAARLRKGDVRAEEDAEGPRRDAGVHRQVRVREGQVLHVPHAVAGGVGVHRDAYELRDHGRRQDDLERHKRGRVVAREDIRDQGSEGVSQGRAGEGHELSVHRLRGIQERRQP